MTLFKTLLLLLIPLFSLSQIEELPDPDPNHMTDEYELIIMDGDTVLRSKVTKEMYTKGFRKYNPGGATFSTDWMNLHWDTKTFNPYKDTEAVQWPLTLSFEGENFNMPIEGVITSRYGWRRGRAHKGIDIDLVTGDNVKVAMNGKVRFARYYSGFGNCIVVRHNNGLETVYAHLSKMLVQPNTFVQSGQVIGKGGNTGRSRGSHLHFEVRWFNQPINPEYLFDFEETKFFTAQQLVVDKLWADPKKHRSYKKSNIVVKRPSGTLTPNTTTAPTFVKTTPTQQEEQFVRKEIPESGFEKTSSRAETSIVSKVSFHVVERGDTLDKIATKYQTSINEICALNGITKSAVLSVGQQLKVR